jgi:hypothetical protein
VAALLFACVATATRGRPRATCGSTPSKDACSSPAPAAGAREDALSASKGETVTFASFPSEAVSDPMHLGAGPIAFRSSWPPARAACPTAEVDVAVTKQPASGPSVPLRHFTTTLVRRCRSSVVSELVPISGPASARWLAAGDRLALTVA